MTNKAEKPKPTGVVLLLNRFLFSKNENISFRFFFLRFWVFIAVRTKTVKITEMRALNVW